MSAISTAACQTCGATLRPWGGCPQCTLAAMLAPLPDEDEANPAMLGDYELLEEIARGGAGIVWRARQRRLNRTVALKVLRESSLPGEAQARRFRIEAEAAAQLRHPHIVSVHEVGEAGGRWFLSMELLAGTLAGRGAMPPRAAAELLGKIARAVQHAHDRGILHRDLKPANVLLDDAGEPRVADFGLARLAEADSSLTHSGMVLGTPAYMPPEQAAGREVTTASDVYALGAIFYELLAGRAPFAGATAVEVLRKVNDEEPAALRGMSNVQGGVPRDLEVIVFKCLEKNPASRYASALALAEDIERWLRGEPVLARRATLTERVVKWARRRPAQAALLAVVVLAVVAMFTGGVMFNRSLDGRRRDAEAAAQATLHRVARQHTQRALHFMEDGDAHRGLLSLAEAIAIGSGDADTDEVNRLRLAGIMRLGPQLDGLWFAPPGVLLRGQFPTSGNTALLTHGRSAQVAHGPALEHAADITGADVTDDGARAVCGTSDGRWTLWDARAGNVIASGAGAVRAFASITACHTDGTFAGGRFIVVDGSVVRQFRAADGSPAAPEMTHARPVLWAALSPDARKVFVLTGDGALTTATADFPDRNTTVAKAIPGLQFHSTKMLEKQGFVAVCDATGAHYGLVGWQYTHPETVAPLHAPMWFPVPDALLAIGWWPSGDSRFMTAGDNGATLRSPWVYVGVEKYKLGTNFPGGARPVAGSFDDVDRAALTLSVNGVAQVWEVHAEGRRGPRLWTLGKPLDARLSADGRSAVIVSDTAAWLWKWRANDGALAAYSAEEWAAFAERVDFRADETAQLADGRRLMARVADAQSVSIADAATGISSTPPLVHPAAVARVRFSRDGRLLCTMWGGKFARVWETATGEPVTPPFEHADIADAAWDSTGRRLATFAKDGAARLWDFTPAPQPAAELMALARLLSAHRMVPGSDSGIMPLTADELRAAWEAAGGTQPK